MNSSSQHRSLTAPERQALIHADAKGAIVTTPAAQDGLIRKGLAEKTRGRMVITDFGRSVRSSLLERHQEWHVEGVPWAKVEEITVLYLRGMSLSEISQITRVPGDEVEAVLDFRRVRAAS